MSPEQLAKPGTEHSHQVALFAWANMARLHGFEYANDMSSYKRHNEEQFGRSVSALQWLHAIPNGGFRDIVTAGKLKAEGVKPGIADIFLPFPTGFRGMNISCGLYIELKKIGGKPTVEQLEFQRWCLGVGYSHCVVEGWRAAADEIEKYLSTERGQST